MQYLIKKFNSIVSFIKNRKISINKHFISGFLTSLFSIILVLAIGCGVIWHSRATIFGYFAKEYIREAQAPSSNKDDIKTATERIIEKETIFTQESFIVDAVKKTNPAVVAIVVSKNVPKYEAYTDPNQQQNSLNNILPGFPDIIFNTQQYRQNGTEKKDIGGGSGFFVSSDGLIVTNKHVVEGGDVEYTVFTNDGKKHPAKVIARDQVLDIALIKIDPLAGVGSTGYPFLTLGNSDNIDIGQSVIVIGNALGEYRNTVSVGVISGLARSITAGDFSGNAETLDKVIQTDAAINPGNSGGPLLNLSGQVIGVNVAVAQGSQSIGFALPINSVRSAIESVKATGKIVRPYLGVRFAAIDADTKTKNNLLVDYGVVIKPGKTQNDVAVVVGSPANKAGLVEGDLILEINGIKLDENANLTSIIRQKNIGDSVVLKIIHKGVQKFVTVILKAAPQN